MYLATDTYIAFKTAFLYFVGLYMIIVLKMLYISPRPYWKDTGIISFMDKCEFDYASPSTHMFNMFFFYGYSIFMYQVKYQEEVNWKLVYALYTILIFVVAVIGFT